MAKGQSSSSAWWESDEVSRAKPHRALEGQRERKEYAGHPGSTEQWHRGLGGSLKVGWESELGLEAGGL